MQKRESVEDALKKHFSNKAVIQVETMIDNLGSDHLLTPREGREPGSISYEKAVTQHIEALGRFIYHKFDEADITTKFLIMMSLALNAVKIIIKKTKEHVHRQDIRHILANPSA